MTVSFDDIPAPAEAQGRLIGHDAGVNSVAVLPGGQHAVSGSDDGTVILWDIWNESQLATLQGHTGRVEFVSFSPDGSMLASGGGADVILWDVASRSQLATLQGHTAWITSVSFSADGSMLASGSDDGTVLLWRLASIVSSQ